MELLYKHEYCDALVEFIDLNHLVTWSIFQSIFMILEM
jgi:hypothetical protein